LDIILVDNKNLDIPNERAQHLLKVLIDKYIKSGHPVSSQMLSRHSGLDVSSATIRSVMADLEDLGFLEALHTSSGKVPTIKGYRFFVDTLVNLKPPKGTDLEQLEDDLQSSDPQSLIHSASNFLSGITKLAGIITIPKKIKMVLRQIEFLKLSDNRVLAIIVLNDKDVQNKILNTKKNYSKRELLEAGRYLTEEFGGLELKRAREMLINQLSKTGNEMNTIMSGAIAMANQAFPEVDLESEFIVAGETNLMGNEGLRDVHKLKELFEAFGKQSDLLELLNQSLYIDGVQIFIGQESGYKIFDDCSIVSAPYSNEDDTVGVLGVIGPTRMEYERVIPIVDITAKLLASALKSKK
tara:strand:- start:1327 stop:2388 length:1062 start_codon:yes stop_codon:yes gene_type:complete